MCLICRSGKSAAPAFYFNFFNLKRIVCVQKIAKWHLPFRIFFVPLHRIFENSNNLILKQLVIWQS